MYSESDIIRGKKILKNGTICGFVRNSDGKEIWRIVKKNQLGGMKKLNNGFNIWWGQKNNQIGGNNILKKKNNLTKNSSEIIKKLLFK